MPLAVAYFDAIIFQQCPGDFLNIERISLFFFNDTATTEIYTLSLHDALPLLVHGERATLAGECHELDRLRAPGDPLQLAALEVVLHHAPVPRSAEEGIGS